MEYLNSKAEQTGLDMNSMQVDVASVNFEKDHAFATISIKPKSFPTSAMQISYTLDRKGDKWVVRPDSGKMHGGEGGADSSALPPGHPSVPSGSAPDGTALPPGHPAVGNSK